MTFVDEDFSNPPIILPKWVVFKYCGSKFSGNVVHVNIVTDQVVANAIMDAFEKEKFALRFNKEQAIMYKAMFEFLVG